MIFRIAACKFQPGIYKDTMFSDDLEELPGDYFITNDNIRKFYDHENYIVITDDGDVEVKHSKEVVDAYFYYFEIWENCKEFGLPAPWSDCPIWLVDFVKYFNRISNDVEIYRFEKERRLNR